MSCQHGNHPEACEECDALDEQYKSGFEHATKQAQAKITDLETKLATLAALVAKKDEALLACNDSMHECAISDLTSDRLAYKFMDARKLSEEALTLTADSVEVVEVGYTFVSTVNGANNLQFYDNDTEQEITPDKLYTIKVKP